MSPDICKSPKRKVKKTANILEEVMITIDGVKGKHGKCTTTYI
jgi:hypothetical protein